MPSDLQVNISPQTRRTLLNGKRAFQLRQHFYSLLELSPSFIHSLGLHVMYIVVCLRLRYSDVIPLRSFHRQFLQSTLKTNIKSIIFNGNVSQAVVYTAVLLSINQVYANSSRRQKDERTVLGGENSCSLQLCIKHNSVQGL